MTGHRSVARAQPRLPPAYWWLFAGMLVMSLATFVFPFLALFLGARGFSTTQAGLIVSLFGAGSVVAGPVAGHFTDRFGRRPTLLVALVATSAITAMLPAMRQPVLLALGTLALGVALHAYFPAANAMVADLLAPEQYTQAFGRLYWARNLGASVSFALGGALAAYGYERLFWADAVTTLAFAAVVLARLPETRRAPLDAEPAPGSGGFRAALADRHLMVLLLLCVAFFVAMFQFMVALPIVMTAKGLSPAEYGRAMAMNGALIALVQPWSSRLTQRLDSAHVLAGSALLVALGYGAYAWCETGVDFALATGVWSLGEIGSVPVVSALVARLSPAHLQGRYQGLLGLSFGVSLTIGPALGGVTLDALGPRALWLGASALAVSVALGHLAAGRDRAARLLAFAER